MTKEKRKPYPSDVSDEEWSFAAPYLTLMDVHAPQRKYESREMFSALRWMARAGAPWRMLPNNFPPWGVVYQQTQRWLAAGCDSYKRRRGSKVHMAVDTLTVHVTPANEQERAQVAELARRVQQATGETVKVAFADRGYTGEEPAKAERDEGIERQGIQLQEAKKLRSAATAMGG